ncbi:MAG: hypothetical protein IJ069_01010 [Prevotella sp.]|nr:hypothetical protein [Prevotella sp.]
MKKLNKFAFAGVIALLSVTGFTACSSGDETVADPNPTFDGNSVKTQFTISLPENIKMRMASATVQESGFRGIDQIKLVPYTSLSAIAVGSSANAPLISLSSISAFDNEASHSKVYADVALAVGTNHFLFYGKAIDNTADAAIESAADKFMFGTLKVEGITGKPTLGDVKFTPVSIYGDGTTAEKATINAGKTVGTNLIAALNAVADAAPTESLSDGLKPKFKEVTATENATINALWNNFKEITTGSSKNIEWVFKELYMNLDGLVTTAAQNTVPDGYKMATAIRTALDTYVDATVTNGVTTAVTLKDDYTGYPASVNLPDGAVRVTYDATESKFVASTQMAYATNMNIATLDNYVYPANLQYFVNSDVKTANSVKSPGYGDKTWTTILGEYTDGTAVSSETRSVAINDPVQYGVGRLDATVKGLKGTSDENNKYYDYTGTEVDVTNGFELTGILIGGQKTVGWNYAVKEGETGTYTIYDKTMAEPSSVTVKRGTGTATNYTLVLQTGETAAEKTVNIALEFVNNCPDFVGANGEIIPNGATFYLVGALSTSAATNKAETAVADAKDRIFTQDFKTIANFTIKTGSPTTGDDDHNDDGLGTATKGLPDLRNTQMELGLSVDLQWKPGLNFDVEI